MKFEIVFINEALHLHMLHYIVILFYILYIYTVSDVCPLAQNQHWTIQSVAFSFVLDNSSFMASIGIILVLYNVYTCTCTLYKYREH